MYAQIFLGIWMLVLTGFHFFKVKAFLSKSIRSSLSEDELDSYQKGLVLPGILIGIIFIVMGMIERKALLSTPVFINASRSLAQAFLNVPAIIFPNNLAKPVGCRLWDIGVKKS